MDLPRARTTEGVTCLHHGQAREDLLNPPFSFVPDRSTTPPLSRLGGGDEPLDRDVHVSLGGGQAGVPEHLLDGPKISPALKQMRSRTA